MGMVEEGEGKGVRFGHVTCSSRVYLYDFGSLTIIQLTVVLHTSAVVIRCLCSLLGVLGVPLPLFLNSNKGWCGEVVEEERMNKDQL